MSSLLAEDIEISFMISSGLVTLTAIFAACVGLCLFAREGILSDDRFHTLHTNLSIALLFFAIGEVIGVVVEVIVAPGSYQIAIALVQIIGMLFWVEGVIFYLYATNTILEFSNKKLIIPLVLILATIPYVIVQLILQLSSSLIWSHLMVTIPLEIGLTIILISEVIIFYHYRNGYLVIPTFLSIIGTFLILIRIILWSSFIPDFATPILQVLAAIAYWFIGFSLFLVRKGKHVIEAL